MAEKYSAQLKRRANRIWRVIHGHPFLRELHAGTLPMDRFIYFILQDYVYLLDGEVGRRLYKNRPSKPKIYREWIETYACESCWRPVREQINLMDRRGAAANRGEKNRMSANFILSSRYEFMFWEQAYRMEK